MPSKLITGPPLVGADTDRQVLAAVRNFTTAYPGPRPASSWRPSAVDTWVVFLFHDGPTRPAGVFDAFFAAEPVLSTCAQQWYGELLGADDASVVKGSAYTIATETTALPP